MVDLDPAVRDAYLRRLGVEAEPPAAGALIHLHRGHVQRIAPIQGLLGTAASLPVFLFFAPTPLLWPLALASPLLIAMLIWSVYAGARRTFQRGT